MPLLSVVIPLLAPLNSATLKLLEAGLIDNAHMMGELLLSHLSQLAQRFNRVSQPRGKGLMVAIDLLEHTGNLDFELRDRVVEKAFFQGLLLLGCGKAAIRFCPALVIDSDQIQVALNILFQSLIGIHLE